MEEFCARDRSDVIKMGQLFSSHKKSASEASSVLSLSSEENLQECKQKSFRKSSPKKDHHKVEEKKRPAALRSPKKIVAKKGPVKGAKKSGSKQKNRRNLLNNSDDRWADWLASEEANRSERKVKKFRFLNQYELDDLRRGTIVYDVRRGKYAIEIEEIEDSYENACKKEQRLRRQRRVNESLNWRLA